ncbi:MAG: DNA-protecting protein DprA [Actinomycetota bacterium]|jgi:DNA processing protein
MKNRSIRRDFEHTNFEEVRALIAWNAIAEPGDRMAGQIIREHGSVEALQIFRNPAGFGSEYVSALERWSSRYSQNLADTRIDLAKKHDLKLLVPTDEIWPKGLSDLGEHSPLLIWYRGSVEKLEELDKSISIVGSRNATHYGQRVTADLVKTLTEERAAIVSGGALGIDAVAHRATLAMRGTTVAIMAGSLDNPYPAANLELFEQIAYTGLVLSEMSPGSKPTRWRFLQRNRLIAALSEALVVTEAGWRSGSINSVNHATELGRPVFAVPGPITSPASAGCNRLIRDGQASLLVDVEDLPSELGWRGTAVNISESLGALELRVMDVLSRREATVNSLQTQSGLALHELKFALGSLSILGLATQGKTGWKSAD